MTRKAPTAWTRAQTTSFVALFIAVTTASASAQLKEVELDRGPTAELYIRKRPSVPTAPRIPKELQTLLIERENQAKAKRTQAIGLLETFLASKPSGETRAEGLFKLAELLWEEARQRFVDQMETFERRVEACRTRSASCKRPPKEPRLDFSRSEQLYRTLLTDHPKFRRMDLVLYLIGFSARERGKPDDAQVYFRRVIAEHPKSPLYGDSWMMLGEYLFAAKQWDAAREAFANILKDPNSPTFDLALFKTAWCDWQLGEIDLAAKRFKLVLDLAVQAETSASRKVQRRRARLRDEALDYLVIVFTEDQGIGPKDIYDFLASIGGKRYSRDVLIRVAEAYNGQSEYDREVKTYQFLIGLNPSGIRAARYQRLIVTSYLAALDADQAIAEMKQLAETYGPGSEWAKANRKRKTQLSQEHRRIEALIRRTAQGWHAQAQQDSKAGGRSAIGMFRRAETAYAYYLTRFGQSKRAPRIRYFRAEILHFRLNRHEEAGDEFLAVGKSTPVVPKLHKDALLRAMAAFEKARPKNVTGKRKLTAVDRKFAAAVDLYATLFPADPQLVGVIFRNGQMFYDYGDYDEAIKRFGLIVTKYPNHEQAGAAGDRILTSLAKAEDYENIEEWARKLKGARGFKDPKQVARLNRLIVESIDKSGQKYAEAGRFTKAAKFYLRIPKEFPRNELAARSVFNAAVMYEKAKRPQLAATTYLSLTKRYKSTDPKMAERAAFTAGEIYESMAYYDRAAAAYERVYAEYPRGAKAPDALFNAGVIRQALGQHKKSIRHYSTYSKRYRKRKDSDEVRFRIGVVYEDAGNDGQAERAFTSYARRGGAHKLEAHVRAGRTAYRLGRIKRAANQFRVALRAYRKSSSKSQAATSRWAAEAKYFQGELVYRRFKAIKLDSNARRVDRTLKRKTKLLGEAKDVYTDVVRFGDPHWATAALYRIGEVYELFAEALGNAPVPSVLKTEAEKEQYKETVENFVVDVQDNAIELYSKGYEKAVSLKVYNKYTKKIRAALGRLAASKFPPENESRAASRVGDRPPQLELVEEVVRDR